jgi:hypothetical protein
MFKGASMASCLPSRRESLSEWSTGSGERMGNTAGCLKVAFRDTHPVENLRAKSAQTLTLQTASAQKWSERDYARYKRNLRM